jgi:hypothetical protein
MSLPDAVWRTSSFSGSQSACVELAWVRATMAIRDSKNVLGPMLVFPQPSVAALINRVTAGHPSRP